MPLQNVTGINRKVMKTIKALGIVIIALASMSPVMAQITAYANIYAEIVSPAFIEKSADLTFSDINTSRNSSAVILSSSDNLTAAGTESVQTGNGTLAEFSIAGNDHPTFDITLPDEAITMKNNGRNPLIISNFTSVVNTSGTLNATNRIIKVGATLHIAEQQAAGNFADQDSFQVTLNYN